MYRLATPEGRATLGASQMSRAQFHRRYATGRGQCFTVGQNPRLPSSVRDATVWMPSPQASGLPAP